MYGALPQAMRRIRSPRYVPCRPVTAYRLHQCLAVMSARAVSSMMRYSFVMPYALPVSFVVPRLSDAKIHKCHNQLQSEFQNNIS